MVMDSLGSERSSNRVSPPNSCFLQNSSTTDVYSNGNKRKTQEDADSDSTSKAKRHCSFTVHDILEELATGKYGSMETEVNNLFKQKIALLEPYYTTYPKSGCRDGSANDFKGTNEKVELKNSFDGLNKESENNGVNTTNSIILIESDEDEPGDRTPHGTCQNIVFNNKFPLNVSKVKKYSPKQASAVGNTSLDVKDVKKDKDIHFSMEDGNDMTEGNEQPCQSNYHAASDMEYASSQPSTRRDSSLVGETCIEKDKGVYVGVEDDEDDQQNYNGHVDLDNIWQEMAFAIESTKDTFANPSSDEHPSEDEEECEHSFILKDDLGYVCRICGVIQKGIESIIEYQYAKRTSTRTYKYEARSAEEEEITNIPPGELWSCEHVFAPTEICPHPRHSKVMKHHQLEGFNFLVRNLVTDDPGGCILAHAPGSGKTFMIISFIQIFMAKYPTARPLIVLPRGILPTWKKEFQLWQIEDIPLLDFYSVNASSRSQQLEVLNQWVERRSILFLGYQQFSSIFRNSDTCKTASTCQKILISQPSILIMDEGHTPRNENTDQLAALERVSTPRKVVLSGTLYQNHVKEVFIILNLVRPKFLKLKACKDLKRRILSRIQSSKRGNLLKKSDSEFYEMVEESLLKDDNLQRKAQVIEDLRAMTSNFLHYYKGDSLDELPGLVDFTVFLNLSPWQKREIEGLKKLGGRFKISSDGSSIYVHPQLKVLLKKTARDDRVDPVMMDGMLDNLEIRAGVKAKFYLNLLRLCESAGEKLLVFSQYLPPMKFLERLTVKIKGWTVGKEIFMITGDSDNDVRESQMEHFNKSSESRVFFGSIRACGEGISLVGASRIIILDVHLNPSVTRQAIARAFRPGQLRKVYTYRLVAAESPEEEDHSICFKKESIPKLWFEWNGSCRPQDFEMETVDVKCCKDIFLETPWLHEDVVSLYKR